MHRHMGSRTDCNRVLQLANNDNSVHAGTLSHTLTIFFPFCSGLPVPASDDPMETDAPAASGSTAAPPEAAAPAEPGQDVEMTGEDQTATSTLATTSQPLAKKAPVDPDAASYLPECITHTARLLESMFSNHDTCQKFVQQGGVEVLLQLYKLPKLPPTFGSSSASHSLLAMFRSLTAHNASDISSKLQPALASQFLITLETAEVNIISLSLCFILLHGDSPNCQVVYVCRYKQDPVDTLASHFAAPVWSKQPNAYSAVVAVKPCSKSIVSQQTP